MCGSPQMLVLPQLAVCACVSNTSMNWIRGFVEPIWAYGQQTGEAVDGTKLKLFDSPVEPPLTVADGTTQDGALVEPSVTAICTIAVVPLLNTASEPPAFPSTLNSAWVQTLAVSVRLSATCAV